MIKTLIEKAAIRCNYDHIVGDYLEFGTYKGRSAINSYIALANTFENRLANETSLMSADQINDCKEQWNKMRFICFDSFQGLPEMSGIDLDGDDFLPGQYACSKKDVVANLEKSGIDLKKFHFVEGWYKDTCVPATREKMSIKHASICWIDCDIYQSTIEVLNFIKPLIVDGTILVFDDWFCYRGSPYRGQQKAFGEFKEQLQREGDGWVFNEFQREASARVAFFCNRVLD